MLSKLFGRNKETILEGEPLGDWSFLKTDMHSHLVPGIDDGAQTIEDSIAMIELLRDMGYTQLVTTPHIKMEIYPNTAEIIQDGLKKLQLALAEKDIYMPMRAAAEYYVDDKFMDMLDSGRLMTIRDNEVLIEFSFAFEPVQMAEVLFHIQLKGYVPIIAHPERYVYFHNRPEVYHDLKYRGCKLQLNAAAIVGYYGKSFKDVAEYLLKEKLYDYCGSDMHYIRHAETMQKLRSSKAFQTLMQYPFQNHEIRITG